jgi:hypothetical protein
MADEQNQPTEGQQQTTTDTAQAKSGETEKLLTQAEVDKFVGARVKESAAAAINKLLAELGFDKADDLKAVVTVAKAKADAEKSELEKANEKVAAFEKKAQEAEARAAAVEKQRLVDRRDSAIEKALKGASKPAAVMAWINTYAKEDLTAVMADDGTIDDKKITVLVDKAKKELPELFKSSAPGSPSNNDGRAPQPDANKILGDKPLIRL